MTIEIQPIMETLPETNPAKEFIHMTVDINSMKDALGSHSQHLSDIEKIKRVLQTLTPKRRRCSEIEKVFLPLKEEILQTISDGVSVLTVFNHLLPYYPEMSISGFKRMVKGWRPGDNRKRSPLGEKNEPEKKDKKIEKTKK